MTCPNGVTRPITRTRNADLRGGLPRLPAAGPMHHLPPAAGRYGCIRHDALQRAHRARARDPEFQAVYRRHRPMVERSISWLVAGGTDGCGSAEPQPTICGCTTASPA